MARALTLLCLILTLTGLPACSAPASRDLPSARPADLSLGLTVFGPDNAVKRGGQRPARYLVEPDGWLRAAVGPGADETVHPPRARWLTDAERDELWSRVRATGLDSVERPLRLDNPEGFMPPAGRRVYLIELTAGGRRVAAAMPEGEPATEPFIDLADALAAWSWVTP